MKKIALVLVLLLAFSLKINAQFVENFDSSTTIPSGWTVLNPDNGSTWGIDTSGSSVTPHSGSNVVKISWNINNDYLVSPQINVTTLNNRFSFWVFGFDSALFSVKLSLTTITTANFSVTLIPNNVAYYGWTKVTVDLSSYMGQNVYVGIHANNPYSTNPVPLYVDDVVNDAMPNCTTISSSYLEDFENQSCWSIINGGSVNTWSFSEPPTLSGTAHSGTTVAQIVRNTTAHNDYLISPRINVIAGVNDRVSFWAKSRSISSGDHFNVKISSTTPIVANFTTTIMSDVISQQVWTKYTIDLTAYVGQSIYIGFHAISTNLGGLYLDDFVNDTLQAISFSENFDTTTALPPDWTKVDGLSTSSYTWTFGPSPVASVLPHSGANVAKINSGSNFIISDDYLVTPRILVATGVNDRVSFWVRKVYSYNNNFEVKLSTTTPTQQGFNTTLITNLALQNTWTKITLDLSQYAGQKIYLGLHSICNQYLIMVDDFVADAMPELPGLPQSFEASNTIPNSWKTSNTSNTNAWSVASVGTSAYEGTNVAKFNHTGATTQNDLLITPQINVIAGVNDRFSFWAKKDDSISSFIRYLNLKVSTTNTNLSSFINFNNTSYSIGLNGNWQLISVDLTPYVGQSIYLGLTSLETGATIFYVDNFTNDRFVPKLTTDCNGIVNLTLNNVLLLNGANPATNSITFFTSYQGAQFGSSPLTQVENFNYGSSSQNFAIYARIFNTITNTFTVNCFSIVNRKVYFDFFVNGDFYINVSLQNSFEPNPNLQWYQSGILIPNATSSGLDTFGGGEYTVTYSDSSGCTKTSDSIFVYNLNDDAFTINLSNGLGATTPSIFLNDFFPLNGSIDLQGNANGFTINEDGTINVPSGTPSGTYFLNCTAYINETTQNGNYINRFLYQNVTIIIPQNGILMTAFVDTNGNSIKDNNEQNFPKGKFQYIINNDGVTNAIVSPVGICTVYETNLTNSYDLSYVVDSEFSTNYAISNATFNDIVLNGTGIQNYYFPITIIQNYNDISISIVPVGVPRPGFTHSNKIAYSNNGTQTIVSGVVTFEKSSPLAILNISQSGTNPTANGFSYNFTNLLPFETRFIDVLLQTPTIPTVSLGQLVSNSVAISLPTNDILPLNNSNTLTQTIIGSYDPNDKTENHGGKILHSTFTSNDYLTYTIQFENTGTANAEKVRINDVLDPKLDENSIRMIGSSHLYTLKRVANDLNWYFDAINLPPSSPNSSIGKGFVTFQIKPKTGFAVGDVIPNTAYIYFDLNPAITTEPCLTEFVATLANKDFVFNDFYFYPNPVKNSLSISNKSIINEVEVTSVLGQKIMYQSVNDLQTEINFSELTNGIYFVKIYSEGQSKTIRVVKE